MNKQYEMVKKFHTAAGVEMPTEPKMLDRGTGYSVGSYAERLIKVRDAMRHAVSHGIGGKVMIRSSYILEELIEFMQSETIEGQVDGLLDQMYFILGTFTEMGVKPERPFDIVANSNNAKILPDGTVYRNPLTGKIGKPPGWEDTYAPEPLIIKEIERQRKEAQCPTCNGESKPIYGLECPVCK